ncbi:MAG: hypothetical protein ACRD5L_15510 [Bryobacteraceae bacterium]
MPLDTPFVRKGVDYGQLVASAAAMPFHEGMKHLASRDFWDAYNRLPSDVRALADRAYAHLKQDPKHPSRHFKRLRNTAYWSVRVGLHHRALAREIDGGYLWGWIGTHAEYDRLIKSL